MFYIIIGLVVILVFFLWCVCIVSSECSEIEEQQQRRNIYK